MDKKAFVALAIVVILTFGATTTLTLIRPDSGATADFSDFPLQLGQWQGQPDILESYVLELLNPQAIFSASYTDRAGRTVHLMFDFFSADAGYGGPHSPRNCLPGSGWSILGAEQRNIDIGDRSIDASRLDLHYDKSNRVMDFWYVTSFGETANDYQFKFYELVNSLTFRPRDVGFIRFVTESDPESLTALDEFQRLAVPEIYSRMPISGLNQDH